MQEQLLINLCKKKDAFSQRRLYEQYVKKVYLVVLRYLNDVHASEELVADVFVKCFDKIGGFEYRGEGSFYGWLKIIAVNDCVSFLRKKQPHFYELKNEMDEEWTNDNDAERKMTHDEILLVIRSLPEGYRTVFNLYAIEGFSHAEIATQLHITEETSRSQLYKARKALQKIIKQ